MLYTLLEQTPSKLKSCEIVKLWSSGSEMPVKYIKCTFQLQFLQNIFVLTHVNYGMIMMLITSSYGSMWLSVIYHLNIATLVLHVLHLEETHLQRGNSENSYLRDNSGYSYLILPNIFYSVEGELQSNS